MRLLPSKYSLSFCKRKDSFLALKSVYHVKGFSTGCLKSSHFYLLEPCYSEGSLTQTSITRHHLGTYQGCSLLDPFFPRPVETRTHKVTSPPGDTYVRYSLKVVLEQSSLILRNFYKSTNSHILSQINRIGNSEDRQESVF